MTRSDVRVYTLLLFALIVCVVMYFGISSANISGKILGLQVSLAGPIAAFPALLLVFRLIGLFSMGLEDVPSTRRIPKKMSKSAIENELDVLELTQKKLTRKVQRLKQMLAGLNKNDTYEEASAAAGMTLVRRPSASPN